MDASNPTALVAAVVVATLGLFTSLRALVAALSTLSGWLGGLAARTPASWDDRAAARLSVWLDRLSGALDAASRVVRMVARVLSVDASGRSNLTPPRGES